ncbi:MAG: hypothetical protein NC081_00385 [Roseburia sp.]|nr:hypothetical protein [Roseburia sp.]
MEKNTFTAEKQNTLKQSDKTGTLHNTASEDTAGKIDSTETAQDFMDFQYEPLVIDEATFQKGLPATPKPYFKIAQIGIVVMAVLLIVDMFLPFLTVSAAGAVDTQPLFPYSRFSYAFILLSVAVLICMYFKKQKWMTSCAFAIFFVTLWAARKAGHMEYSIKAGNQDNVLLELSRHPEAGYYGMFICSIGLLICVLAYAITSSDSKRLH